MKKRKNVPILTLFVLGILSILSIPEVIGADVQSSLETVQNKIDDLPSNPEEIKNRYLVQEWSTFIANNKILGPAHTFFLSHQLPFSILFGTPYEISITFFTIILLWLFCIYLVEKPLKTFEFLTPPIVIIVSLAFAVILAHIGVLKTLATFMLNLIFSRSEWYMRIILGILILGGLFVIRTFDMLAATYLKAYFKKKHEKTLEETTAQTKAELLALERGLKEGSEASKKLSSS